MRDNQFGSQELQDGKDMSAVALSVVARLAARNVPGRRPAEADLVQAMKDAIVAADPAAFDVLRLDLRRARITEIDLVDCYFPAVARALGCDWVDDTADFAAVTIGMARLQALLHRIVQGSFVDLPYDSPSILVVLATGEQHSFGVQVLAEQLRRSGAAAHVMIAPSADRLQDLVRSGRYDGAMVSVGCEQGVEPSARIVKQIKRASGGQLWVAVGGAMLDRNVALRDLVGGDIATQDPMLAMAGMRHVQGSLAGAVGLPRPLDTAWKRLERA